MHLLHNAIKAARFSIYPGTGETLLERKPPRLVAVALANKFARIAWRFMYRVAATTGRSLQCQLDLRLVPPGKKGARRIDTKLAGSTCRKQ